MSLAQAAALHQAGRLDEAADAYRALLAAGAPGRPALLQLLALAHVQQGRLVEALEAYDALAAEGGADAAVHRARGDCLLALGRAEAAVEAYDAALAHTPDQAPDRAEALNQRGLALEALGRLDAALAGFDAALALRPDFASAHNNRGVTLARLQRFAEAVRAYDAALALAPGDAGAWSNRSAALRALGRIEEALDSARRALALRPDFPDALNAEGLALAALNQFEEALESYDRALALRADHRDALNNSGVALTALRRFDEAGARHAAALALDPAFAEAEYNLALLALRRGDPAGWRGHEARWRRGGQPGPTYPDSHLWLGGEDIAGKTLLLHAEQGLGDALQFARYGASVRARGARVVLQVQPELVRLMRSLDGPDAVVAIGEPLPPVDRHIPLMSLPLVFGPMAGEGYLRADPEAARAWRARLPSGRPRIGVTWAGNPAHGNDRNRSIPLAALRPLLDRDAAFVSLQKDVRPADAEALAQSGMEPFPRDIADLADAAALVEALDLVISVDTSVAHLSAALGRPTWMLVPRFPDWRWGEEGETSPWYPTLTLFRQAAFGRWEEPVAALGRALDAFIAAGHA